MRHFRFPSRPGNPRVAWSRPFIWMALGVVWWGLPVFAQAMTCTFVPGDGSPLNLEQKRSQYEEALRLQPGDLEAFCRLSHLHFKLARGVEEPLQEKEYAQCIQYADEALARDRQAAVAYFLKGLCLGKLGELRGIWASLGILQPFEENMLKALELDPAINKGGPHRALGRYYFLLPVFLGGSLDKAVHHLENAVRLSPDFWENLLYLAEAYLEDQQLEKARSTLTQFFLVAQRLGQDQTGVIEKGKKLVQALETQTSLP